MLQRLIHKQSPTERPRQTAHRPLRRALAAALCACLMLTLLPANALAADTVQEQFTGLTVGETYYFDLSGQDIPNSSGTLLSSVGFTYVGTVNAYSRESAGVSEDNNVTVSPRSLFIANSNVIDQVSWTKLNDAGLIFGKDYTSNGVTYRLRAPSAGSSYTGSGDSMRGVPATNEWDAILDKNGSYILHWSGSYSWGQDTQTRDSERRANRGSNSARYYDYNRYSFTYNVSGFRPVLEVLNPGTLGSDGLRTVTLDLNGGSFISEPKATVLSKNTTYTAPAWSSSNFNPPDVPGISFKEWNTQANGKGTSYAAGASVPASVATLYAIYKPAAPTFQSTAVVPTGATVSYTLTNKDANATYTLYDSTGNNKVTSNPTMSISGNTLTLTFSQAPTSNMTFYVSATGGTGCSGESDKTKLTLSATRTAAPTFSSASFQFDKVSDAVATFTLTNGGDGYSYRVVKKSSTNPYSPAVSVSGSTVTLTFSGKALTELQNTFDSKSSADYLIYATDDTNGYAESTAATIALKRAPNSTNPTFESTTITLDAKRSATLTLTNLDSGEYEFKVLQSGTMASSWEVTRDGNTLTIVSNTYSPDTKQTYSVSARSITDDKWWSSGTELTVNRYPGAYATLGMGGTVSLSFFASDEDTATATDSTNNKVIITDPVQGTVTPTAADFTASSSATEKTPIEGITVTEIGEAKDQGRRQLTFQVTKSVNVPEFYLWYNNGTDDIFVSKLTLKKTFIGPPNFESATAIFETAEAYEVKFNLIGAPNNTTYKVYAAAEGGDALTYPVVSEKNGVLSLKFMGSKPSAATKYYISAKTGSNAESSRTEVTVKPYAAPTYGVTLDPAADKTFTAATVGYGEQTAHTVTVQNSGNRPTGALTVALSGDNADSFTLSKTTISNIYAEGSDSFTVTPNTGLAVGTYTATVTVSGGNSISASFNVSFTVTEPPAFSSTTATFASSGANSVTFTLTNAVSGGTYKVYAAATEGEALTDPAVSVTEGVLTLTFTSKPTAETKYYISATTGSDAESGRTEVTVKPYAAPSVALGEDKTVKVTFQHSDAGTATQTDTIGVTLNKGSSPDASFQASDFSLSSSNSSNEAITGLSVTAVNGDAGTLTVQMAKSVTATSAYLWYGGKSVGEVTISKTVTQPTTYTVTIASGIANGTVSASPTSAAAGKEITLTISPNSGYELDALSVYKTGETSTTVTVNNKKFTMPAYDVTVSATFKATTTPPTSHSVTYTLTNLTATNQPDSVNESAALSATLTAASGYKLPTTITVTMGGTTLTANSGYTYNSATGVVSITSVTGDVVITAAGVAQTTPPPSGTAPTITTTTLTGGTVGEQYSATLTATGDTPITWSVSEGSLPAGLSLSGAVISGTPTAAGTSTFTIKASNGTSPDATKQLTIKIDAATQPGVAPEITTTTLTGGTVGEQYSATLTATGDTPITWSVSAGSLPAGLSLTGAVISGTPTAAGTSTFTIKASNGTSPDATKQLTIKIDAATQPGVAPEITTTTLTGGTVGVEYSQTLTATGDTPITWSVSEGSLPAGLFLSGAVISGTPTAAGTSTFTIKASNGTSPDATKQLSITIDVPEATVTGVTVTPGTATVKKGTTQQFTATVTGENNPAQIVTWSIEGDHADGTTITDGLLTVDANETATTLTVTATSDVDSSQSATATVTVTDQDVTRYTLSVTDGSGSGDYEADTEITVTAETKANQRFKAWMATGIELADATENPVTITMPAGAVELTATYEDVYAVTASGDSNGTATASPATAAQGETVTLTATANSGYQFKAWTVISGGITLDANASTSFTMPGQAVEVKVVFELQTTPPTTYTVTFDADGGSVTPSTAQTGANGKLSSLPTPTRSGSYRFDYWQLESGTQVTLDTEFTENTTVKAHWTYTGGSGGGNNNSTTTETTKNPDGSTTTTTTDKRTGTVTETTKAPDGTKTVTETKKDGTVTETVNKPDGTETETIKTPEGKITETLKRPDGVKTETVTAKNGETTAKVTVPSSKDSATVTLPVKDAAPGTVAIIVHADGTEEIVKKSISGEDGLTLTLEDSAELKIVDNSKDFADVPANAWYADAVDFASSRDLFQGTGADTFSPGAKLNRGMLVTVLYRLQNEPDVGAADFTDVKDGAYYAEAVAWAAQNEIVAGIGNGQYAPGRDITRQELATMLYRYAGHLGLDLSADSADLGNFKDGGEVSSFAQDPMKWCVAHGIISGKGNGVLDPSGNATRAEAVSMLMRFVDLLVK